MKNASIILFLILLSCSEKEINPSFYYWKTNFTLNSESIKTLEKLNVKTIYVKYFDVKWIKDKAVPIAEIKWHTKVSQSIVPVVYLTTQVFKHMDSIQIKQLSKNVANKIKNLHQVDAFTEIQFDCDWTPSVKYKYFYFLEQIKPFFKDVVLSSTIRLYQYKYPDIAGVPPVDKGALMYYNMGSFNDRLETNSILNNTIGKQYVGFNKYPLPIDLALPNFSWGLMFKNDEFIKITKDFTEQDYLKSNLLQNDTLNYYYVKLDTVINDTYYQFGDEIRFERCSKDELLTAAGLLVPELNQTKTNIIIYDLNNNVSLNYEKINTVYNAFK